METLVALAGAPQDDGTLTLLSPAVGEWTELPRVGTVLGAGQSLGTFVRLNRRLRVLVPPGVQGRVRQVASGDRRWAVGYGDTLLTLSPIDSADGVDSGASATNEADSLAAGQAALRAPTDGVFYRRPSPDAPPFVEVGQRVGLGHPVGLVEVMKTFNQVRYGGDGLPPEAEVLEVRVEDGDEVRAGQILIVVSA